MWVWKREPGENQREKSVNVLDQNVASHLLRRSTKGFCFGKHVHTIDCRIATNHTTIVGRL
jgi:hypothetical protein